MEEGCLSGVLFSVVLNVSCVAPEVKRRFSKSPPPQSRSSLKNVAIQSSGSNEPSAEKR